MKASAASPRSLLRLAPLLVLLALPACDDDGPDPQPDISVASIANELQAALGGDQPAQQAEKTMLDLARQTCRVMAQAGGCASGGSLLAASPPASETGLLGLLATRDRWDRGRWDMETLRASSEPLLPAPPLGATCIWNVETDLWAGSPPIFGEVPDDRTRFEGYETEPGRALEPLERTGQFFDVAPIVQANDERTQPGEEEGDVRVELENREATTDDQVVSLLLTGSVDPSDGDVVDLLLSGRSGSDDATALDLVFSIDRTELRNTMEVQDLLIISELDASGAGRFFIQRRTSPRQIVEFTFDLGTDGQSIATGEAAVDAVRVATMSGGRGAPTFDVVSDRFDEADELGVIYDQLQQLDLRVIDLFFFSYCIGANVPDVCNAMRDRLGLG